MNAGKSKIGYAIMSKAGRIQIFDARMPIYWLRNVAVDEMNDKGYNGMVVRVSIEKDE